MTLTPTQRPTSMTNELHPGEVLTAETVGLLLKRVLPVSVRETPDYAELTFGESSTQAMTTEPETWLALNHLPDLIASLSASDEGRGSRPAAPSVPTEGEGAAEPCFLACGDHRDTHYAVHGPLGHIASGLPPEAAASIVNHLNQFAAHPQEAASVPGEGGDTDKGNHDCLAKRRPDEPMFILLGRDPDAHNIVRTWADRRLAAGGDPAHCQLGYETAERMRLYASDPANRPASAPDASAYTHPAREDGPAGQWQDIATAPKDGTKFLARCGDFQPFECQWDGERFVHFDPDDGVIVYPADKWHPLNRCPSCRGFGYLDQAAPTKEPA